MPVAEGLRLMKSPLYVFSGHLKCKSMYAGFASSNRLLLLKEKVCLVAERLVSDLLIFSKDAVDPMQN
jgi:hypothetical protein